MENVVSRIRISKLCRSNACKISLCGLRMLQRGTRCCSATVTHSHERSWLYRGTDEDTVLKIVRQGFNRSFGSKEINQNALSTARVQRASTLPSALPTRRVTDTAGPTALETNNRCSRAGCSWGSIAKAIKSKPRRMFATALTSMTRG